MTNNTEDIEMRTAIESALHIDWAFKGVNGKPDKIIVSGTPKGAYHTSYDKFVDAVETLIQQEANRQSIKALYDMHEYLTQSPDINYPVEMYERIKELENGE